MEIVSTDKICMAVKVRPLTNTEVNSGEVAVFQCQQVTNSITQQAKDGQPIEGQYYQYDKIFGYKSRVGEIYPYIARDIVKGALHGDNGAIFAYGQMSSGKSFLMFGDNTHTGLFQHSVEDIFYKNRHFNLKFSFIEIYNDKTVDLLVDDDESSSFTSGASMKSSPSEAVELLITDLDIMISAVRKGISRRKICVGNEITSSAPSSTSTGTDNNSLRPHTVLKDMKLTRLLRSSTTTITMTAAAATTTTATTTTATTTSPSNEMKISVLCCISPTERCIYETRRTLQFASLLKETSVSAVINRIPD
eukprot:gene9422-19564_t